jgi:hypothetical protein
MNAFRFRGVLHNIFQECSHSALAPAFCLKDPCDCVLLRQLFADPLVLWPCSLLTLTRTIIRITTLGTIHHAFLSAFLPGRGHLLLLQQPVFLMNFLMLCIQAGARSAFSVKTDECVVIRMIHFHQFMHVHNCFRLVQRHSN